MGQNFDQVLSINSLHWSGDWKSVVAAIDQALTQRDGARVNLILASAGIIDGRTHARHGIDTDEAADEFEKYNLRANVMGLLNVESAQLHLPTSRFFAVFERDSAPRNSWRNRVDAGDLTIIDYTTTDGIIETREVRLSR